MRHIFRRRQSLEQVNCWTLRKNFWGRIISQPGIQTENCRIVFRADSQIVIPTPQIFGLSRHSQTLNHAALLADDHEPSLLARDIDHQALVIKVEVENRAYEQISLRCKDAFILGKANNVSWKARQAFEEVLLLATKHSTVTLLAEQRRKTLQVRRQETTIRFQSCGLTLVPQLR